MRQPMQKIPFQTKEYDDLCMYNRDLLFYCLANDFKLRNIRALLILFYLNNETFRTELNIKLKTKFTQP
jgi:hypothetical protein